MIVRRFMEVHIAQRLTRAICYHPTPLATRPRMDSEIVATVQRCTLSIMEFATSQKLSNRVTCGKIQYFGSLLTMEATTQLAWPAIILWLGANA